MRSVLDGGSQILLANILTPKRLICTYAADMARPVPSHDYVLVNRSMLCNCHMESGLTCLFKSIAFCETASADYTMSFVLNLAFLHMIQDLWPGNFSQLPPVVTKEELSFPLGLTSNADFCKQNPNGIYPIVLMREPQSLSALHSSLRARALPLLTENPLFFLAPGRPTPLNIMKRVFSVPFGSAHILFFYWNHSVCLIRPPALCLHQARQAENPSGHHGPVQAA